MIAERAPGDPAPGRPPTVRDAGLQAERTALAWSRTGLAILGNAVLVLRGGVVSGNRSVSLLGCGLLAAAAVTFVYSRQRRRDLAQRIGPVAVPAGAIGAVAVAAAAAASLGVVLLLVA